MPAYEYPSPPLKVSNAVHFGDTERKEAAECTGNRGSGEEQGLPELDLVSAVPHGEIIRNTGYSYMSVSGEYGTIYSTEVLMRY